MPKLGYNNQKTEYLVRCPKCGDSDNLHHGHLSINVHKGVFQCLRCGYVGLLTVEKFLGMDIEINNLLEIPIAETHHEIPILHKRDSYTNRPTKLPVDTYKFQGKLWDGVEIVKADGSRNTGIGLRQIDPKRSYIWGNKYISYPYQRFSELKSWWDDPITVVEGIYDVLNKNDVCVWGFINRSIVNTLKGHYVILQPDGDVWDHPLKKKMMLDTIQFLYYHQNIHLVGLHILPDGKDVDEISKDKIIPVPYQDILKFIRIMR